MMKSFLGKQPLAAVVLVCFLVFASGDIFAQKASTSSPYSKYGIGELRGGALPQTRAMGGISTGVRYIGAYSNINTENPASYSALQFTTTDVGVFGNIAQLSNASLSENSYNFALSHLLFAFPLARAGGLSFGIKPYSDVGYSYSMGDKIDTTSVNKVYAGEGGTSSAYAGYGVRLNNNFSVGVNVNYIFGTLNHVRSVEFPAQVGALNGRENRENRINGFTYGYGVQYFRPLAGEYNMVIGYSGTMGTRLASKEDILSIRTPSSVAQGTEGLPVDTISFVEGFKTNLNMPFRHSLGFTFSKGLNWMVGGDVHYETWSDFQHGGVNQGLRDSYGFAVGGQIIPDPTSVKYFSVLDYRLGFKYNKTFINIANQDVNMMAVTLGLGFPLPSFFGSSFYKINVSAELGQMGKVSNQLVRERFANLSLGFTLNDRWFARRSYD